jgi:ATP-dependent Clp protease ATP-binding subunit ClpC
MFDRFSEGGRKLMSLSRQAAQEFGHDYIGTEHVLLGMVAAEGTVATKVLGKFGIDAGRVRAEVTKRVRRGDHKEMRQLPFTPGGRRVLEGALEEAQAFGHQHIGTGHVLLGLLRAKDATAEILGDLGLTLEKARPAVLEAIKGGTTPDDGPPGSSRLNR